MGMILHTIVVHDPEVVVAGGYLSRYDMSSCELWKKIENGIFYISVTLLPPKLVQILYAVWSINHSAIKALVAMVYKGNV